MSTPSAGGLEEQTPRSVLLVVQVIFVFVFFLFFWKIKLKKMVTSQLQKGGNPTRQLLQDITTHFLRFHSAFQRWNISVDHLDPEPVGSWSAVEAATHSCNSCIFLRLSIFLKVF